MNVAVSLLPGVDVAPTVEKFAVGGLPAVPSAGATAPSVHVPAVTALLAESLVARWMLNERIELTAGDVNWRRTSSAPVPASKLPVAAERSVGASAPRLMQMLKVEMPAAFGSYAIFTTSAWVELLLDAVSSPLKVARDTWVPRTWKMSFAS